jgi:hypothetical protein
VFFSPKKKKEISGFFSGLNLNNFAAFYQFYQFFTKLKEKKSI